MIILNIDFKAEIQKQGFRLGFIADKLGISQTAFSNKLAGRYKFTAEEFIKLVNILKINPKRAFKEA